MFLILTLYWHCLKAWYRADQREHCRTTTNCACRCSVSKDLVQKLTKGGSWALLRMSAVESIALAQPFCINQAVGLGDLLQRLHAQFVVVRPIFPLVGPTKL